MINSKQDVFDQIIQFYVNSNDYNGIPFSYLHGDNEKIKIILEELIKEGLITINYGDYHPNPHINAFNEIPQKEEIEKLQTELINSACIYPTKKHLVSVINVDEYKDQPFTCELSVGTPQLVLRHFDLTVLEMYRNDPRYYYDVKDTGGSIHVRESYYDSKDMKSSDKILLKTFGFGYSKDLKKRIVVVYLRYLSDLSPEHQQIWKSKSLEGVYVPHPDYHRTSMGHFAKGISIFISFTYELMIINMICDKLGRISIFRNDFFDSKRPKEFSFLIRPTLKEYYNFILTTDKMISENINIKFFNKEVKSHTDIKQKDGIVIREPKGSLTMLNEWLLQQKFIDNKEDVKRVISIFKAVRKERQNPAHSITNDEYDNTLFEKQRELIRNSYQAICDLRHMLAKHPEVGEIEFPYGYLEAKVWDY